jgi:ferredoxin
MAMNHLKTEMEKRPTTELEIGRMQQARLTALTLDKKLSTGCGICKVICPRKAIEVRRGRNV